MSHDLRTGPETRSIASLREEVASLCAEWRAAGRYTPQTDCWVRGFDPEFSRELGRRGLLGISWPVQYGGGGLDNRARLAITEELLRVGAPVAAHWVADRQIGPAVLAHGSEPLKASLIPLIVSGEAVCALGMSEPEAGSDLSSLRTSAVRDGDEWVITGQKVWTSFAHQATHLYVLARTETLGRPQEGLTEFVIDMDSPGVTTRPIIAMSGEHHFNEVFLDSVRVPDDRVLGSPGNGWRQVIEQLSIERGGPERVLSTYPLLVETLRSAASDPVVIEQIGLLAAQLSTLRRMYWNVAEALDEGKSPVVEAAILKYLGNRFENDVIDVARSAGLGEGATRSPFEAALLASPGFTIRGGSADVLLGIIARAEARRV